MEGILIVDKPSGMTSHDVVSFIRRRFKMRRVGHAGTLDPLATGVLIMLIGPSTKLFSKFEPFDKTYLATLLLGTKTDSSDIQGKVIEEKPYTDITEEQFKEVMKGFVGEIQQVPPMVSAVKINGKKLYELAREGKEVPRPARNVRIDELKLVEFASPYVKIYLECSKGTYVRQLAHDIGDRLGCGACITQIRRAAVGPFTLERSVQLEEVDESKILSPESFRETTRSFTRNPA